MAAAVAFWAVLSLSPLLLLAVTVAGVAFGDAVAREVIEAWIVREVGGSAASTLIALLEQASAPRATTLSGLVGVGLVAYGASRMFYSVQEGLNQIWNVRPKPRSGLGRTALHVLRKRAVSFGLVVGVSLLLLATLAIETALPAVVPGGTLAWKGLLFGLTTLVFAVAVGLVLVVMPDAQVPWSLVWRGALVTSLLLMLGKTALSWYLSARGTGSSYGAAGSVAALLIWLYVSAQLFFLAAELTQAYASWKGITIAPDEHAERASPDRDPGEADGPVR